MTEQPKETVSFSNGLTPAETERLALLAEECGECIHIIGKILRHGYDSYNPLSMDKNRPDNRELLTREVGDIYTAIYLMFQERDLQRPLVARREDIKREHVNRYLHHNKVRP
jgi:hypothetical protein